MSKASDLLLDIASEKNGYSIGQPWRFTEFSLAAIVPIIRVGAEARGYRLMSEVKDKVKVEDTGHIDILQINNRSVFPVLVKAGEVVVGDTQTRTLTKSEVLMPGEKVSVNCVCVHSSKGIYGGQKVSPEAYSPADVRREVYGGYYDKHGGLNVNYEYTPHVQQQVWGGVNNYSRSMCASVDHLQAFAASGGGGLSTGNENLNLDDLASLTSNFKAPSEDLAGRIAESQDKYKEILKNIPTVDNQVGMCLLAMVGADFLEVFNNPDSWDAIRQAILKSESYKISDVSDQDGVFEFKEDKAKDAIRNLLQNQYEEKTVVDKENTKTFILDTEKFTGEVVTLYDIPIHCAFVKKAS